MEKKIDTSVWVVYSPDERIWFLERREPGNWAVSEENFNTDTEAVKAYRKQSITWLA